VDVGESWTRWTIRLALGCYVLAVLMQFVTLSSRARARVRLVWTIGCLAFLAHVGCVYHGWSHAAAYEETARQTAALFGFAWGGGLYFNYAFTLAWMADVLWWWHGLEAYRARPRWIGIALHSFFAFMALQATVVFATGPVRWLGLGACLGLGLAWWRARST
jgi:hypothetical protein